MTQKENINNVKIIDDFVIKYNEFKSEISKVIVGQNDVVDQVLLSIFCNGHCLLWCSRLSQNTFSQDYF